MTIKIEITAANIRYARQLIDEASRQIAVEARMQLIENFNEPLDHYPIKAFEQTNIGDWLFTIEE